MTQLPTLIGLDIGFGETKVVSSAHPEQTFSYQSFVQPTEKGSARMMSLPHIDPARLNVEIDGEYFFIGDYAKNIPSSVSKRTKAKDRGKDKFSQVLFRTAIALACPHEAGEHEVSIVTGLPNMDYESHIKDSLQEYLSEDFEISFILSPDKKIDMKIKIKDVEILKQPEGSMSHSQFSFSTDKNRLVALRPNSAEYIGLVDIGHYTTDYGLFNQGIMIQGGEVSGSTIAVDDLYRQFRTETVKYFSDIGLQYEPTDSDLDRLVREKKIKFAGEDHDMSEIHEKAVRNTAERLVKQVQESWKTEINRVDKILITGGGAHVLAPEISRIFTESSIQDFEVVEDPTMANAMGFYMFGVLKLSTELDVAIEDIREKYINPLVGGGVFE